MANNSYIENFKSYTDWGTVIVRSNRTPLDRTSIFGSYNDALSYAKGDGSDKNKLGATSYIGQIISVHENGITNIYQIIGDDTISPKIRDLRKVASETELNAKCQENTDRLISQNGSIYDCENGVLTLATNDPAQSITIHLTSDYGTF